MACRTTVRRDLGFIDDMVVHNNTKRRLSNSKKTAKNISLMLGE